MSKRPPALKKAQAAYEAAQLEQGAHIQVNLKLKASADIKAFGKLRKRFPDLTDTGIVRMAVKELAGKGNK